MVKRPTDQERGREQFFDRNIADRKIGFPAQIFLSSYISVKTSRRMGSIKIYVEPKNAGKGGASKDEPLPAGRYFAFSKIIYRYAFGKKLACRMTGSAQSFPNTGKMIATKERNERRSSNVRNKSFQTLEESDRGTPSAEKP